MAELYAVFVRIVTRYSGASSVKGRVPHAMLAAIDSPCASASDECDACPITTMTPWAAVSAGVAHTQKLTKRPLTASVFCHVAPVHSFQCRYVVPTVKGSDVVSHVHSPDAPDRCQTR